MDEQKMLGKSEGMVGGSASPWQAHLNPASCTHCRHHSSTMTTFLLSYKTASECFSTLCFGPPLQS